ncbi:hypothetical protein QTJ16_001344 [Diplocarpon rosae]|uniref:Cation efflux protein cytoplasmic domain-containing protein n=1 Tax=Diplocarpon rosae TaxID=946125 RepID=A0AAD9T7W9_9HELO|nr:hypothetical protein QTJ16_001344 [Diplocarpon rosae]
MAAITENGSKSLFESDRNLSHTTFAGENTNDSIEVILAEDPYSLRASKREELSKQSILQKHKTRKVNKYYNRQNALIDAYLGAHDEEAAEVEDQKENGGKIKFAVYGSTTVNLFLFVIQVYAAVSTGSLSLFGTAADAFVSVEYLAKLKCSVTDVSDGSRQLHSNVNNLTNGEEAKDPPISCGMFLMYFFHFQVEFLLAFPGTQKSRDGGDHFILCFDDDSQDHRNDIVVNIFGLIMSIVGTKFRKVWFLDPAGAICIAILILSSWASTAYEHMWFLVGKTAPQDFLNKLVYVSITHDSRIKKIDTARAYHAGDKYYAEVDIIMDENELLKITHDVSQTLQRKLEGLADVERAFVHVDYEGDHSVFDEHKPLYEHEEKKAPLLVRVKEMVFKTRSHEDVQEVSVA